MKNFDHNLQPLFIAEVGVNHNGSVETARKLIDAAKDAGASIVKFQTFVASNVVTKTTPMTKYQSDNLGHNNSQYEMLKKLELSFTDFSGLKEYCDRKDIEFLSTGFDRESLEFLATLKPRFWKIPSGEINNLPYLEFIARQPGTILLSTGMSTLDEVKAAWNVLKAVGGADKKIFVMHCTSDYPAKLADINLKALYPFKESFGEELGYSDHSIGIEVSLAAISLGAKVIEKHITLDVNDEGPDHRASITPLEFKSLVALGKNIFEALGVAEKKVSPAEEKNRKIVRRSILAKSPIKKGEIFSIDNLHIKRPGTGMSPMNWHTLLGRTSTRDYSTDDFIDEKLC